MAEISMVYSISHGGRYILGKFVQDIAKLLTTALGSREDALKVPVARGKGICG